MCLLTTLSTFYPSCMILFQVRQFPPVLLPAPIQMSLLTYSPDFTQLLITSSSR